MKPSVGATRDRLFPLAIVSRRPLRKGLEYGMTVRGVENPSPNVPVPIRSSMAQDVNVHRFQLSRNIRLLHGGAMILTGNPVLKANSIPVRAKINANTPRPVMTRFGVKPRPGATVVFPRVARGGTMGSPKRFPKAIAAVANKYRPPVYGATKPQVQTEE